MQDVTLEITRECPLNCLICSSNGGKSHSKELSLSEWYRIINESIGLGADSFLISGGEPFNQAYLLDLCKYIVSKNLPFTIYSSGNTAINGKISPIPIEYLKSISKMNNARIIFSLHGANCKTHDSITQTKGSFNNTLLSIQNAIKLKLLTELHFVPVQLNYKELPDVIALAKDLDVKKISILRFVAQERGKANENILELETEKLTYLKEILSKLSDTNSFIRIGAPFSPFAIGEKCNCTAGTDRMTIRYDGLVVPCEAMKFMAGYYGDNDIRKYSLKKIWKESELFEQIRESRNVRGTICNGCNFLDRCQGGCPAQRILNGSLKSIDPYCQALSLRAE